jgi:hypothetical protein
MGKKRAESVARSDDIATVKRALELIDAIPPWNYPAEPLGKRVGLHARLKDEFQSIWARLEGLYAEFLPAAAGPRSPACTSIGSSVGTPVTNLLHCHDLCPHCLVPARRTLVELRDKLAMPAEATSEPSPRDEIRRRTHRSAAPPGWIYSNDAQKKYELAPSTFNGYRIRIEKKNSADVFRDPESNQVRVREGALRKVLGLPSKH